MVELKPTSYSSWYSDFRLSEHLSLSHIVTYTGNISVLYSVVIIIRLVWVYAVETFQYLLEKYNYHDIKGVTVVCGLSKSGVRY